jgi:Tol biopolymer transport system component
LRDVKVAFIPIHNDNSRIAVDSQFPGSKALPPSLVNPKEKHLTNIRQLTFGGENAEAYLSPDEKHISFQARSLYEGSCDQIFTMTLDGKDVKRISTGHGKTTCSYYLPSGDKVLYASTEAAYAGACPPEPDKTHGYVWALDPAYDIYVRDTNGTLIGRLTDNSSYYDAEATVSPKGDHIVFTSTRSGDVDLYSMNIDGSDVKQLTNEEGYDGGAFFSKDGSKIVYRASRPIGDELTEYRELLKQGLIKPHSLEIYVMDADGSNKKQVTHSNAASFAPFFFPNAKRIIFSSNMDDPAGREFELYLIKTDGSGLERLTYSPGFDGFPVFTSDGKHLIFCSNRNSTHPHETNIFIADWVD